MMHLWRAGVYHMIIKTIWCLLFNFKLVDTIQLLSNSKALLIPRESVGKVRE